MGELRSNSKIKMNKEALIFFLLLLFLFGCSTDEKKQTLDVNKLGGEYLGEPFPYGQAEIFLNGLIGEKQSLQNVVFSPNGKEFFFTRTTVDNDSAIIFSSKLINDNWTEPQSLYFCDENNYMDPFVSYDNQKLFFTSDRPVSDRDEQNYDFNIWYVKRIDSSWSEPIFPKNINSMDDEYFPSLSENNTIYFSSTRKASKGYWDIYKSELIDNEYLQPVRLSEPVNGDSRDWDPFISRIGNELYFVSDRSGSLGGGDIYYTENVDGVWSEPVNIGERVNTNDYEYCPRVSYDNNFLFFTRNLASEENFYQDKGLDTRDPFEFIYLPENGVSRVYWIAIDSLSIFR